MVLAEPNAMRSPMLKAAGGGKVVRAVVAVLLGLGCSGKPLGGGVGGNGGSGAGGGPCAEANGCGATGAADGGPGTGGTSCQSTDSCGGTFGTGGTRGAGGASATGGLTGSGGVSCQFTDSCGGTFGTGGIPGGGGASAMGGLTGSGGVSCQFTDSCGGTFGSGGNAAAGGVKGMAGFPGLADGGGPVDAGGNFDGSSPCPAVGSGLCAPGCYYGTSNIGGILKVAQCFPIPSDCQTCLCLAKDFCNYHSAGNSSCGASRPTCLCIGDEAGSYLGDDAGIAAVTAIQCDDD